MSGAAPMALNLILGHSPRAAISTMERCRSANTVCVVSPSPRAERRMNDEDLVTTFTYMGSIMKRVTRMETHFYSSNSLWLPAKALTGFLQNAGRLEDFLLNGCRIKGTDDEIANLGIALLQHPTLRRVTFFNIAPLLNLSKPGDEPDLRSVLEGVTRNPSLNEFTIRFAGWAHRHLPCLVDPTLSNVSVLKFSGKEMMYGRGDEPDKQPLIDLLENLKTNMRLKELWLQQAPAPLGSGIHFADMLRENEHLQKLHINLADFSDCIPIAKALEQDNDDLTWIELHVDNPNLRQEAAANSEQPPPDPTREEAVKEVQDAFEKALFTNGSLIKIKISSRNVVHTTEKMEFFASMNEAGRMEVLTNDDLTGEEAFDFLDTNCENTSMTFHMLNTKPGLLPLTIDYCTNQNPIPRANKKYEFDSDSESDDDKPIRFLVSKAKIKSNRKRPKNSVSTTVKAARAKTLKRRRRFK